MSSASTVSEIDHEPVVATGAADPLTPYTKKWVRRLLYLSFLNFMIAGTLALFMRTDQGGAASNIGPLGSATVFGQLLTAHGLGMFVGWQFPFAYGLCSYVFPKYMKRKLFSERLLPIVFYSFAIGFYMVWFSIFWGFGPGWYFLWPLPFHGGPAGSAPWGLIQAAIFFAGMILANLSLFVFAYNIFGSAFSGKYKDEYNEAPRMNHSMSAKFAASIGFDAYMPKAVRSRVLGYPVAVIAAMVTTLDMVISAPPFFTLLVDGFWTSMSQPGFLNNLVAKNFLWINYHPIVYFAFFPLIGMYYTLVPIFANRNFSSMRWAKAPWPILLITGVGVYSHHLFIDTSQPYLLQFVAQNMSMSIGFASGISVFTLFALIWRSKYNWTLTAKFLFASIIGWIVGGVMGVENGNNALDLYEHNTYIIVSHFHFNALDGIVLAAFGVLYWILPEISNKQWYSKTLGEIHFWGTCVGGFGLAFDFAAMGYLGVPRREYNPILASLPFTQTLDYHAYLLGAFFFAFVAAAAQIPFIWNIIKTLSGPSIIVPAEVSVTPQVPVSVPTPVTRATEGAQGNVPENAVNLTPALSTIASPQSESDVSGDPLNPAPGLLGANLDVSNNQNDESNSANRLKEL
ncbi:MAG TPA: cbb3-type cytochrome c oxidase subunit I [Nitrososphaerales archaeon]|nr:cbb3-type cytochrome c oxidase subunit I [Nitrososphaerales archaeon]